MGAAPPSEGAPKRPVRRVAWGGLLLWALAALAPSGTVPPAPLPADAPDDLFAAGRALEDVRRLAKAPRPPGTVAHALARDHLLERLRGLGLETEVVRGTVAVRRGSSVLAARVENVIARRPGRAGGPGILLTAHYDSRPQTPGAADDAAGVAAILETVRALEASGGLQHDLVVLFSDGEELGLLGARAAAATAATAADIGVVLNVECRGNRGPSLMFETSPGNLELIRAFEAAAPRPAASSLSYEVYRRMPNDTDFTVWRQAGKPGLNFACLGHIEAYHTWLDTAAALDEGMLQHHGATLLALARALDGLDLDALASSEDAVYFNLPGGRLAAYRGRLALPLAVGAALVLAVLLATGRWRRQLSFRGLGRGILLPPLAVAAGVGVAWLGWYLLESYLPGLAIGPHRLPLQPGLLGAALLCGALATGLAVMAAVGGGVGALEAAAGVLVTWGLGAVLVSAWTPGASYPLLWGLAGGLGGLAGALAAERRQRPALVLAALGLGALPAVLLFGPIVRLLLEALTVRAAFVAAMPAVLAATLTAPLCGALGRAGRRRLAVGLGLAAVSGIGLALAAARPGPGRPSVDTLSYVLAPETGEAHWLSTDPRPDRWTRSVLGEAPPAGEPPPDLPLRGRRVLVTPAPPLELVAPDARVVEDAWDGRSRRLDLLLESVRGAPVLRVEIDSLVAIRAMVVEGRRVELASSEDAAPQTVGLVFFGLPAEGLRLSLEMADRQAVELRLADQSWGLPEGLPGGPGPRPPGLMAASGWRTDSIFVYRRRFL